MFSQAVTLGPVPKKYHSQLFFSFSSGSCSPGLGGKYATANVILKDSPPQGATHSKSPAEKLLYPLLLTRQLMLDHPSSTYHHRCVHRGARGIIACACMPQGLNTHTQRNKREKKREGEEEGLAHSMDARGKSQTTSLVIEKNFFNS